MNCAAQTPLGFILFKADSNHSQRYANCQFASLARRSLYRKRRKLTVCATLIGDCVEKERDITFRGIVREHLRQARWSLLVAALSVIGFTLTELVAPWPLKIIFDHILLDRPPPASLAWLSGLLAYGKTVAVVML